MNSGAESLLVRKARGLRHLFATVPAMLIQCRSYESSQLERMELHVTDRRRSYNNHICACLVYVIYKKRSFICLYFILFLLFLFFSLCFNWSNYLSLRVFIKHLVEVGRLSQIWSATGFILRALLWMLAALSSVLCQIDLTLLQWCWGLGSGEADWYPCFYCIASLFVYHCYNEIWSYF